MEEHCIKLYSRPLPPYSSIIRCIAYQKQAPLKIIAPPQGFPIPEEFRAISPFKRIPVLVTGSGLTVLEASVIAEYLEEHFPQPRLLPADSHDRAIVRMTARTAELEVLAPVMELFELLHFKSKDQDRIRKLYEQMEIGLIETEKRLGSGTGPYALGDTMTMADAWLTPTRFVFNNFRVVSQKPDLLASYPKFD